jgi:hypothetical protein
MLPIQLIGVTPFGNQSLPVLYADKFKSLVAGDLNGQDGYTKLTSGSNPVFQFVVDPAIGRSEFSNTSAGNSGLNGWTKSFNAFAGRRIQLTTKVLVSSSGSGADASYLELIKGALDLPSFSTDALDIGVIYGASGVTLDVFDDAGNPQFVDLFPLDTLTTLRAIIETNGAYELFYNVGAGYVSVHTGNLISGNENVDGLAWLAPVTDANGHFWYGARFEILN